MPALQPAITAVHPGAPVGVQTPWGGGSRNQLLEQHLPPAHDKSLYTPATQYTPAGPVPSNDLLSQTMSLLDSDAASA